MPRHKKVIVEYRYYNLPLKFPVILLDGERWRISEIKSSRLHFHNCLEIGICHSDSGIMEIEGTSIPFYAGDVTCVPRHIPHTTYSSKGEESLWSYIFFEPEELFRSIFTDNLNNFESPMSPIHNYKYIMNKEEYPKVHFLTLTIIEELRKQKFNYQASVKGLLLSLYIELFRIHSSQNSNKSSKKELKSEEGILAIADTLEFIHTNYMQPITIEDMANICHLSVSHFRRTFHSIMGATPLDFLNSTRIDEALRLLRSTGDSILTISEQVGFHSISSFNRVFIKLLGVSPRVWRNQALQSEANTSKTSILEFTGWM